MSSHDPFNASDLSYLSEEFEHYKTVNERSMIEMVSAGHRATFIQNAPLALRTIAFRSRFDKYECFSIFEVSICWRLFSRSDYGSREVTDEEIRQEVVYCCGQKIFDKALEEGGSREFSEYCDRIRSFLVEESQRYNSGFRSHCRGFWKKIKNSFRF